MPMNTSPAAIKQRLLAIQTITKQPYNLLRERYAQERSLYRISKGPHATRFMVKGGMLVTALTATISRATRDIDVRGEFDMTLDTVRRIMTESIDIEVEPDGLVFSTADITLESIREKSEYGGVRCKVPAMLGNERIPVQIDIGAGDRVYQPMEFDFPTLIDGLPHARLLAYSVESIIAEKLEAMANLGDDNGRSKDFADVVALAKNHSFRAGALWAAIDLTFSTRKTEIARLAPSIAPLAATPERERHYTSFLRRAHAIGAPSALAACMAAIETFVAGPMRFSADGIEHEWDTAEQRWHEVAA
jgi:predicted nucleotidyltransferase component of viral defense system